MSTGVLGHGGSKIDGAIPVQPSALEDKHTRSVHKAVRPLQNGHNRFKRGKRPLENSDPQMAISAGRQRSQLSDLATNPIQRDQGTALLPVGAWWDGHVGQV